MSTITIKIEAKQTLTVNITVPWFAHSKDKTEWLAVIGEDSMIEIIILPALIAISQKNIQRSVTSEMAISRAWNTFDPCTEDEWMAEYEAALQSLSLKPVMK